MFRLLDYNLPDRALNVSLKRIYGLGLSRSKYICSLFGLGNSFNIVLLNRYMKDSLRYFFAQYAYVLGPNLKFYLIQRFEVFIRLVIYKGMRFLKGLPWHGQRTITNSRSTRRFVKLFSNAVVKSKD